MQVWSLKSSGQEVMSGEVTVVKVRSNEVMNGSVLRS
jgi:hypothetical protein